MAYQQIETGYKPEFGLGAVYQGENAANSEMSNQLEFVKQFLANQHSQQMNPLTEQTAQQNLDINDYKTTQPYKDAMTRTQVGQSWSSDAAGRTANALQPLKQRQGQGELQNQITQQDMQSQLDQLNSMLQTEPNPLTRMAIVKERERMLGMLKETPTFVGKRELRETGTESAEYIAEESARWRREAARQKAESGEKSPDSAEKILSYFDMRMSQGHRLTQDEVEVYKQAAARRDAQLAAKTQPSTMLDTEKLPGAPLKEKPTQPKVPTGYGVTIKYDSQGNRIQ